MNLAKGILVKTATKSATIIANGEKITFNRGSLLIPVSIQKIEQEKLFKLIKEATQQYNIQVYSTSTGYSLKGVDLGSSNFKTVVQPKVMMLVTGGVSSYESGEVWHLFEKRFQMPISKVPENIFYKIDLNKYNVIVLVSGNYNLLSQKSKDRLKTWVAQGNTLITIKTASSWAIKNKIVNEKLIKKVKDSTKQRIAYEDARGTLGKQSIGGAIFNVDLDITHPLAYGYYDKILPVYKKNKVFLSPSKNRFSTVVKYTKKPHVDGYVTQANIDNYITKSAAIIVSRIGKGRVVLFADNPNFRGAWYGTNKLFMNAIFFGQIIRVP